MSGEEILQQWLSEHPAVVDKYQEIKAKAGIQSQLEKDRRRNKDASGMGNPEHSPGEGNIASQPGSEQLDSSSFLSFQYNHDIPAELQPYKDILPPSLLPLTMRLQFPCSSNTVEWGCE